MRERLTEEARGDSWKGANSADKKSGLKAVTLIAAPNPVSQVLW